MKDEQTTAIIREQERRRCQALVDRNFQALADLVSADLIHIHANGKVDDYASYMAAVENRLEFLTVTRGDLDVRALGDLALATGPLYQVVRSRADGRVHHLNIVTSQLWSRQADTWRQVSFHATAIANPAGAPDDK